MASEHHNWTVPAPLRALLWWPPVAFVLVVLYPSAAVGTIALAGAGLAVLGVVGAAVGGMITRRLADRAAEASPAAPPRALALPSADAVSDAVSEAVSDAVSGVLPGEQRAA
jgi:hypothetical protein